METTKFKSNIESNKETSVESNNKAGKSTVKARRYFAGANTKHGFYNLFGEINQTDRSGLLYILKGGPGTGKSTLMKKVGAALANKTDVEYFYCASDNQSLDGVRIPAVNIAVADGTAPHVTEASMPGIREKIIDLGAFIGDSVGRHEAEIAELTGQKKLFFAQAYLYIKNASNLYECNNLIFSSLCKDADAVAKKHAQRLFKDVFGGKDAVFGTKSAFKTAAGVGCRKTDKRGRLRRLFLSAAGSDVDFAVYNNYESVIGLDYDAFLSGLVLRELADRAIKRGLDIICFCNALSPEEFSGVFFPQTDVLIRSSPETAIRVKDKKQAEAVRYNNAAIKDALSAAARALTHARHTHKKIEALYFPAMDFPAVDKITQKLIGEIGGRL